MATKVLATMTGGHHHLDNPQHLRRQASHVNDAVKEKKQAAEWKRWWLSLSDDTQKKLQKVSATVGKVESEKTDFSQSKYDLEDAPNFIRLIELFEHLDPMHASNELEKLGVELPQRLVFLKEMTGQSGVEMEKEAIGWRHSIPLINIFYDFFLDEIPAISQTKETVANLVVVAALNTAIVIAVPMAFTLDEFDYFLQQFEDGERYQCIGVDRAQQIIHHLVMDSANSFAYSATSTLVLVLIILGISIGDFNDELLEKDPYAPFSIWFKYMKYTLLAALSSLLTGILYNIYSVVDVYMIKFPDFWIQYEANGACSKADWTEQYAPDEVVSVWGFSRMKLYVTMSTGLTATLLFMSAATRGKYRAERNLKGLCPCAL